MNIRTIVTAGNVFFNDDKCLNIKMLSMEYCAMCNPRSGMNSISGTAKTVAVVSKTCFAATALPNAMINLMNKTAMEPSI